ncbi:hypothetical protein ECSTECMHI813_3486 [Escherichia coli STEC_MHI813]|nr:hypothetical protein ECSTECMHI813_3486 [Escherichia coli STEC_MHI813]
MASKSPKRSLAPDPVAARDKLREPRSGDFVRLSLGVQGAAIGRPLRAPAPVTLYGIAH